MTKDGTTGEKADATATGSHPEQGAEQGTGAESAAEELGKMAAGDEEAAAEPTGEEAQGDEGAEEQAGEAEGQDDAEDGKAGDEEAEEDGKADEEEEAGEKAEKGSHRNEKAERRIGELTARAKAAEAERDSLRAAAADAEAKAGLGLHPSYLAKEEADLIRKADELERKQAELFEHIDEGMELADGKSLTKQEVRREYMRVQAESLRIGARANAVYEARMKQMLDDMRAGRALREAREQAAAGGSGDGKGKQGSQDKTASAAGKKDGSWRKAPAAPTRGVTAAPAVEARRKVSGQSLKRFLEAGASRSAAARELAELAGD